MTTIPGNTKHNLALIGAGAIGKHHLEAARECEVPVSIVVDTDLARAKVLADEFRAKAADDIEVIWNSPDVTAVFIAVPNCFHKPIAIAAMRAGKDVLLEKPMCLNTAECDEVIEVARETNRIVQIGMVHRYTGVGSAAIEMARSGQLGKIYHVKAHLYQRRGVPGLGGWFTTRKFSGGGVLIDIGVHLLDLAMAAVGFPAVREVTGAVYSTFGRRMRDYTYDFMWAGPPKLDGVCDVEDAAHALIRFSDQMTLDLHVTWAANFPTGALPASFMGFFGDQAGITFELFGDAIRVAKETQGKNVDEMVALKPRSQFADQLSDFLRATESRVVTGADMLQGRSVQAVIDAIYESSRLQKSVP